MQSSSKHSLLLTRWPHSLSAVGWSGAAIEAALRRRQRWSGWPAHAAASVLVFGALFTFNLLYAKPFARWPTGHMAARFALVWAVVALACWFMVLPLVLALAKRPRPHIIVLLAASGYALMFLGVNLSAILRVVYVT